jgi:hypothetical protein
MIPNAVFWIWGVTLVVVTLVIVPLAVYLLHRTLRAAMAIERCARESREAGAGVATNTAAVAALEETIAAATSLLDATTLLKERATAIADAVGGRTR